MTVNAVGSAWNPIFVTGDSQKRLGEFRFFAGSERGQVALALSGSPPPRDQPHPFRPVLFADMREPSDEGGCYSVQEATKRIGRLRASSVSATLCSATGHA